MRRLLSNCRRLLSDRRGNIAILFGLAVVPIFGIMGAALDYSMANMQRTALQAAADNTVLALSKMMPISDEDLNTYGWKIFQANLGANPLEYGQPNLVIHSAANGKLDLQINTLYPMTLGSVISKWFGTSATMPVNVHSEVQWGNTRLRVALVLDNSLSMDESGKMGALKTATTNLLTTLKNVAKNPEDVYVSIIPFSTNVNIDPINYSHNEWIDFTAWDTTHGGCSTGGSSKNTKSKCEAAGTCSISSKTSQSSCTGAGVCTDSAYTSQSTCQSSGGNCSVSGHDSPSSCASAGSCSISGKTSQSSCTSSGSCSISNKTSQSACTSAHGTWTVGVWSPATWSGATWKPGVWTPGVWTSAARSTWSGCVIDRGLSNSAPDSPQGLDQSLALPASTSDKWIADSDDSHSCPVAIKPLTNTWTDLTTTVTNMDLAYSTNQPIGLVWAWQTLRGGGPMGTVPAKDPNYAYSDTIILMSDGLNTMNRWNTTMPSNTHVSLAAVDKRMYDNNGLTGTCQYVKSDNIQIFSVQVNTGGDATSTLLQNCASNTSMFFELKSATALITTFDQIGSALANIHISQ